MPEPHQPSDRTEAERATDHAGIARLAETLVPALVARLNAGGLGELEIREGDWKVRLRRPASSSVGRRADRPRLGITTGGTGTTGYVPTGQAKPTTPAAPVAPVAPRRTAATSPAVGLFRPGAAVGTKVRAGDRIATVDLLGIPQDVVAPIDGVVAEVLARGGEAVEYGEEVAVVEAPAEPPIAPDGEA